MVVKNSVIKPEDIIVYIMSHNRTEIIRDTIDGFLGQSIKGFGLYVVDNSSEEQSQIIKELCKKRGVEFIRNQTGMYNIRYVQQLELTKTFKWIIAFHDDDLIHPQYIEHVLKSINVKNNVDLVVTLTVLTDNPDCYKWKYYDHINYKIYDSKEELALDLFCGAHIPFCSTVYQSTAFVNNTIEGNKYGKTCDRPFMISCVKSRALLLDEIYVQTRTNTWNRDSNKGGTALKREYVYALIKNYRELLNNEKSGRGHKVFLVRGLKALLLFEDAGELVCQDKLLLVREALEYGCITYSDIICGIPYFILYSCFADTIKKMIRKNENQLK